MANYKQLIPFILKWEGGYVNDPDDAGGATNRGVTIGTYTQYRKRKGLQEPTIFDLKKLSEREWEDIFKTMYWDRYKADLITSQAVANICVDWVWASGVWGIKLVQRILGVKEDGIVGSQTIGAINARDSKQLFHAIKSERVKFIDDIIRRRPANAKFRRGWLNRLNDLKYED